MEPQSTEKTISEEVSELEELLDRYFDTYFPGWMVRIWIPNRGWHILTTQEPVSPCLCSWCKKDQTSMIDGDGLYSDLVKAASEYESALTIVDEVLDKVNHLYTLNSEIVERIYAITRDLEKDIEQSQNS